VAAGGGYRLVVTVEDNGVAGGFGDAYARAVRAAGVPARVRTLGLTQEFLAHGQRRAMLCAQGLDASGIATAVRSGLAAQYLPVDVPDQVGQVGYLDHLDARLLQKLDPVAVHEERGLA
jgi:hypothetical protein